MPRSALSAVSEVGSVDMACSLLSPADSAVPEVLTSPEALKSHRSPAGREGSHHARGRGACASLPGLRGETMMGT
ncbi:Uncharacterised protein [Mycobacteroides abscessus subsp. abscessus]|nr:Uncharacterised protein [Mycobacteroides abscessus subsp. abscessus]